MKKFTLRIILLSGFALIGLFYVWLSFAPEPHGIRDDDSHLVAQWQSQDEPDSAEPPSKLRLLFEGVKDAVSRIRMDMRIEKMCVGLCALDGNDIGGGIYNEFFSTRDVPETVKRLIEMEASDDLPSGMRIGVVKYTNAEHTDWVYEPVYPPTLKEFDLSYSNKPDLEN